MKIILQNVYHCEYCEKKQFRKCDMSKHEKNCKQNPNNKHKCFEICKHLLREEEEYICKDRWGNTAKTEYVGIKTVFKCALTSQKMYSYIAERKRLPAVNEPDTIRMPLECDKYEDTMVDLDLPW
jgi:hypothetical protein